MAVTFLIRPITEKWTFEKINNRKMGEMFAAFKSTKLPPLPTSTTKEKKIKNINLNKFSKLLAHYGSDLESISSDEEIYLNQLMESSEPIQQQELNDKEKLNDKQESNVEQDLNNEQQLNDIEIIINDKNPSKRRKRPHRKRTQESRKRRNKKRNDTHRFHRYRYYMTQPLYYRYSLPLVRKVLDEYNIDYVHIKEDDGYLVVGLKNKWVKKQYKRQIPEDLFDGRNYQCHYRRHYRRHQRQQRTK
jgi:hypothetical protein